MKTGLVFVAALALLALSSVASGEKLRVLVLLDDLKTKATHSIFLKSLSDRGYELDIKLADDDIALQEYGNYLYDKLVLFAPTIEEFGGSVDVGGILDFIDSGHDLILAASPQASDAIREIAEECGVLLEPEGTSVIDHISHAVGPANDHTLVVAEDVLDNRIILGGGVKDPVLFRGIGQSVPEDSTMVVKILSASPSAYSAQPAGALTSPPAVVGSSLTLVSAIQARNNARVVISGSLDLFSDALFEASVTKPGDAANANAAAAGRQRRSGNQQLATELSKWVFHERGSLQVRNLRHVKVADGLTPTVYRINDEIEFSVEIYEKSGAGASWVPFAADDVQVEFTMLDPHVRKTLTHNGKGLFSVRFQAPDVYGVFKFVLEYNRLGYTSLSLTEKVGLDSPL
eukprot:jgi/Mesvir1/12460/Mv00614-RA.1